MKENLSPLKMAQIEISETESRGREMLDISGGDSDGPMWHIKDLIWANYVSNMRVASLLKQFEEDWAHISTRQTQSGLVTLKISLPPLR
jgi:hypothetical protein